MDLLEINQRRIRCLLGDTIPPYSMGNCFQLFSTKACSNKIKFIANQENLGALLPVIFAKPLAIIDDHLTETKPASARSPPTPGKRKASVPLDEQAEGTRLGIEPERERKLRKLRKMLFVSPNWTESDAMGNFDHTTSPSKRTRAQKYKKVQSNDRGSNNNQNNQIQSLPQPTETMPGAIISQQSTAGKKSANDTIEVPPEEKKVAQSPSPMVPQKTPQIITRSKSQTAVNTAADAHQQDPLPIVHYEPPSQIVTRSQSQKAIVTSSDLKLTNNSKNAQQGDKMTAGTISRLERLKARNRAKNVGLDANKSNFPPIVSYKPSQILTCSTSQNAANEKGQNLPNKYHNLQEPEERNPSNIREFHSIDSSDSGNDGKQP